MNDKKLKEMYAWTDIAKYKVGDHTWITTYKPGAGEPDVEKGDYWYCWGVSHESATLISSGIGGIDFANIIAKPHNFKESVGIKYGMDGVCHQMANRILRFCMNKSNQPIKVEDAKGYQLSVAMYGEYGGKSSVGNKTSCEANWIKTVSNYQGNL